MGYFVMVTLDMHGAVKKDYDCLEERMEEWGLHKGVHSDRKQWVNMPDNTYVGNFTGESAEAVADQVRERVYKDIQACGKTGRVFALVGGDWAWASKGF